MSPNLDTAGIQTESPGGEAGRKDWRAAMEHSQAVLSSQEQEMKEYLRRQQAVAEKQLAQHSPAPTRKLQVSLITQINRGYRY